MVSLSTAKAVMKSAVKNSVPTALLDFARRYRRGAVAPFPIYLDYPIRPRPRYGWGAMPHPLLYSLINNNRDSYRTLIGEFSSYKNGLQVIPWEKPDEPFAPYWSNPWVRGIDAASLYAFPHLFTSNLYIEIGSDDSTKFVRKSIKDNRLKTQIISVDPEPRAEIDLLCDSVIRSPVEEIDITLFDQLQSGDILMVDNSHRCFQNSDVTAIFLDILPRLKVGVIIYIDDILLPYDYPPGWLARYYSEQYVLAVMLLADSGRRYETLLPAAFISMDREFRKLIEASWREIGIESRLPIAGNGFWMRVKAGQGIALTVPSAMDNAAREAVEVFFREDNIAQAALAQWNARTRERSP
jgi:hypothetical protein